ncbi:patatin-like phospholipase domain-containing protein 3 isoform X4 [Aedes aegypti]|uniref:triacylglycerol lipase n=1 Tax=Aedes aegypti TaxID=7159 RepID=A0A6I8TE67_AEDAE|nr:patatin-like phospholipase domain-containing protein 3 isoform X4 [Aedes aegypti]XP_021708559.1 patatin-like phospholipase domain-containing protein 3 isoform X4 [Aedes aegypti]
MATKMNLSFAGCGFLGIYHVGVAVCFKKYAPHLLLHRISGASAGSLAACCLLCDMPLGEMTSDFFRVVNEARSHSLGPFSPRFNIQTCLLEGLQKFLPPDAHERVNGKLHISLTRVYDGKNVIVSQFNSREDLLQALLCACFIPVFSGLLPPRFHGVRYMDGAFSDNLPTLDENTVTVSPFCGESDICPRDNSSQMFHVNWANTSIELSKQNMNRFGRILFPPRPEILSSFCQQGFDDALNFLHRNNLISCTRCLSVQSTFSLADQPTQLEDQLLEEYDPECSECKECNEHRQNALDGSMPDTVLTVFQTYIEEANKGLMNWVFRHRGARLLKALSLPATLPADIMVATLSKLLVATPTIGSQLWSVSKFAIKTLNAILQRIRREQQMAASLECQVAYTEYSGSGGKLVGTRTKRLSHRASVGSLVDVRVDSGNELIVIPGGSALVAAESDLVEIRQLGRDRDGGDDVHPDYDTFDHILEATSHHDAMYAYYYLDADNKVKVTEIFDMTDDGSPALQTVQEREVNQQLEYDNDWETRQPDFLYTDSYDRDNLMDFDELFDPHMHHCRHHYGQLQQQNHSVDPVATSAALQQWQQLQIEELPSDDGDNDTLYLQPEADQQQALLSEATSLLLSKPPASSVYSIVEM